MKFDVLYKDYPRLENDKLLIKQIEHDDIDDFYALMSDEELYQYKPGKAKKNKKSVDNMIDHYVRDFTKKKMIFLGIYLKGEKPKLIGLGEVFDIDKKTEQVTFGYTLNKSYWGNGYARTFTYLLLDFLFNEIEVNRVQAFVMPENTRSHKVLKACNFNQEGVIRQGYIWKNKGLVDLSLYAYLRDDYQT